MKRSAHDSTTADLIQARSSVLGLELSQDRIAALGPALDWLYPAALRLGLTNYRTAAEFVSNLALPVLDLLQPALTSYVASPTLDFGAGSGAVGLSLAILRPDLQVVLADRRTRVVQFLDLCLARLQVANCMALQADLANPPDQHRASYGLVLVRAFGPTPRALRQASGLLRSNGAIALWHQPPPPQPPDSLEQAETTLTGVPSLALTIYRRPG